MRLYVSKKEALTLISAIESYISKNPQSAEAQELLSRIYVCLEKQGKDKAKKTLETLLVLSGSHHPLPFWHLHYTTPKTELQGALSNFRALHNFAR